MHVMSRLMPDWLHHACCFYLDIPHHNCQSIRHIDIGLSDGKYPLSAANFFIKGCVMGKINVLPLLLLSSLLFCSSAQKSSSMSEDDLFRNLAVKLSSADSKMKAKTVAIYGFQIIGRGDDTYTQYATEKLTHELVSIGRLSVIERSRIDEVLNEQQFSMSGAVDSAKAAKIGKILAVEGVVIGTITIKNGEAEYIARIVQSENAMILSSANERQSIAVAPAEKEKPQKNKPVRTADVQIPQPDESSTSVVININKTVFSSSEPVSIKYSGLPGNQYDWITLVSAENGDSSYGEWFYTKGEKEGTYTFNAQYPGNYEVRVYYNWPKGGYVVQKRLKITVK